MGPEYIYIVQMLDIFRKMCSEGWKLGSLDISSLLPYTVAHMPSLWPGIKSAICQVFGKETWVSLLISSPFPLALRRVFSFHFPLSYSGVQEMVSTSRVLPLF
jgi:hypothetical protein